MYTTVACNIPASVTFVSSLEQSGILNIGIFSGFSDVDRFSLTCVNRTKCEFTKRVKSNKRSSRYRLKTIYTLIGVTESECKETVTDNFNFYVNKKGIPYPFVKTTGTFNWGEVYLADDIPKSERNKYVPFPSNKILLKQSITRKSNPLYACLQRMWKDRLEKQYYKQNSWAIPNDNDAHHILPVEYGGLEAFGYSIDQLSQPPNFPDLDRCFKTIKVGKFNLDNGVLLSKPEYKKFSEWWRNF